MAAASSSSSSVPVTSDEFRSFHRKNRDLFTILVINLYRDPMESMYLIALWCWLEEVGFPNLVHVLLSLNDHLLVNTIAEEGVDCLNCILSQTPPPPMAEIPLTRNLLGPKKISLQFLVLNKLSALTRMTRMIQDQFFRAFKDITQQVSTNEKSSIGPFPGPEFHPSSQLEPGESSLSTHPSRSSNEVTSMSESRVRNQVQVQDPDVVPPEGRMLFLTFGRGYRITERELIDYFVQLYGDCIEWFAMEEVPTGGIPQYARLVFRSYSTIQSFFGGCEQATFTINDRFVRARHLKLLK